MRLAAQGAVAFKSDVIDFVATSLFRRRQDRDAASFAHVSNGWHGVCTQDIDFVALLRLVHQSREIDIQRAGEIPERGNRRAAFAAFNLADHGPGHTAEICHRVQRQPLSLACLFQAQGEGI